MERRMRVGVVYGGRSGEHEVSLRSAASIVAARDLAPIPEHGSEVTLPADPTRHGLLPLGRGEATPLDVVFPVLHGTYGEDGTIQGLLELADVPYVGAGVLASAVGMDKALMKSVFRAAGLPIVKHVTILRSHWESEPKKVT